MSTARTLTRHSVPATSLARASLVVVLASIGCGAGTSSVNNDCPAIASTGGDPAGTWAVTQSCQIPYVQMATTDWCSQLVYSKGTVKDGLFLGQAFIPLTTDGSSTVTYTDDMTSCPNHDCGTYSAMLVFVGPTTTNFPLGCLEMHMPNPTCADLTAQIQALAVENALSVDTNISCVDDGKQGCDCSYTVTTAANTPDIGSWRIVNNLITHYPSLPNMTTASIADIAIDGATMQLHGHDGVPLLAHDPLRSLTLQRKP